MQVATGRRKLSGLLQNVTVTIHSSGQTVFGFLPHKRHHTGCRLVVEVTSGMGVDGIDEFGDRAREEQASGKSISL